MQTQTFQSLHDSSFMRLLGTHASAIVRDAVPKDPKIRRQVQFTRDLTAQEHHTRSTLIAAGHLIDVCDQMVFAAQLLSGYRSSHGGDFSMTRFDYLRYQIENHIIRVGMILDRALKLVNIIFDLGIPSRESKYSVVAKNAHVQATDVADALEKLQQAVSPSREQRNTISHQRSYYEDELYYVEMFSVLQRVSERDPDSAMQGAPHLAKKKADEVVQLKRSEFQSTNARVFGGVGLLFEALIKPYSDRYQLLLNAS